MDLGVRPQAQMLWGDDLGPETDVDHPEQTRDSRPESSQGDVVDGSSDSDDDGWKYVKGNNKSKDKCSDDNEQDESKSQLNPNATEFVPVFPTVDKDEIIASSPGLGKTTAKDLDNIVVPSESEFDLDISMRACDLDPASELDIFNSSTIDPSHRKEDIICENGKPDGPTAELSLQSSEQSSDKIDNNPFINESKTASTDNVDFVQDYFGKNELDFKPFESVAPHHISPQQIFECVETTQSHVPNSVSAEISSHFNFIDSHLDSSSNIDKHEETEKERNHLEIKEPESPVNSKLATTGVIDQDILIHKDDTPTESQYESHSDQDVTVPKMSDPVSANIFGFTDVIVESDLNSVDISLPIETNPFVNNDVTTQENKSSVVEEMIAEASSDHCNFESEKTDVEKPLKHESPCDSPKSQHFVIDDEMGGSLSASEIRDNEPSHDLYSEGDVLNDVEIAASLTEEVSNVIPLSGETGDIVTVSDVIVTSDEPQVTVGAVDNLSNQMEELMVSNIPLKDHNAVDDNGSNPVEIVLSVDREEHVSEPSTTPIDDDKENVYISENNAPHQIDTIGPNAFNFSQPYEVKGGNPMDFVGLYSNDIMTTSMHESLEHDSSFEFINESAAKELPIIEVKESESISKIFHQTETEDDVKNEDIEINNGLTHPEPRPDILSTIIDHTENVSIVEAESAIIESHEMPSSREPDVVFVEQICPSVEVRSDEASPVNKEINPIDTVLAAASITAAVGAAATVAILDEKIPESPKKEETKAVDPKTAVKAPATKKPATNVSKVGGPTKSASAATATKRAAALTGKPKAPVAAKPASTLTSRPKPLTGPTKPATTGTASTMRPQAKTSAPATSTKVPAKPSLTSTTKAASAPVKLASRPGSAPSKTTTLSLASTRISATTKAPLPAKKPMTSTAKPMVGSRPATSEAKPRAVPPRTTATSKPAAPKTTSTVGTKPPTKLGLSSSLSSRPKTTSPTKPAPIKAKSPLVTSKKPTSAPAKKPTSTLLDKNAKNAVKSVPKIPPHQQIAANAKKEEIEPVSLTTNGHHIENGSITPLVDVPSHII